MTPTIPSGASELRCARCTVNVQCERQHVPLVFVPRVLVQREGGGRAFVPVLQCPSCEQVEEWLGPDLMASTSEAAVIIGAARHVLTERGGPTEVIAMLSRIIQRFNNQVNHEFARYMRARLGK